MSKSIIETPLYVIKNTILEVSTRIQDLAQQLCQIIICKGKGKSSKKKLCRQQKQHRKIAKSILKHFDHLYRLRRQARAVRKYYRQNPAPSIFAKTGLQIKQESHEN